MFSRDARVTAVGRDHRLPDFVIYTWRNEGKISYPNMEAASSLPSKTMDSLNFMNSPDI